MVLDQAATQRILDLVRERPRTINELAIELDISWKTADRYVEAIKSGDGAVSMHTFRQGTRGALKVVYWNQTEPVQTKTQEFLFKHLELGKRKEDFSPLDIYQFADPAKKRMILAKSTDCDHELIFTNLIKPLSNAQKSVCGFSGNLSWINTEKGKETAPNILSELLDRKIDIKMIARVEVPSIQNLEKLFSVSRRAGREIEVRHLEQPLRGFIIDDTKLLLKETKVPEQYRQGELDQKLHMFYEISDPVWVKWTQKVFWHCWQNSFDAKKRSESLAPSAFLSEN